MLYIKVLWLMIQLKILKNKTFCRFYFFAIWFLILLYTSNTTKIIVDNNNKYIKCKIGTGAVCKNILRLSTSAKIICNTTALTILKIIKGLVFIDTL